MGEYPLVRDVRAVAKLTGRFDDGREFVDKDQLWAACEDCVRLIDGQKWEELLERGLDGAFAGYAAFEVEPRESARKKLIFIYMSVFGKAFKVKERRNEKHPDGSNPSGG